MDRTILNKSKILILDEAALALDNKKGNEVQRVLDNIEIIMDGSEIT